MNRTGKLSLFVTTSHYPCRVFAGGPPTAPTSFDRPTFIASLCSDRLRSLVDRVNLNFASIQNMPAAFGTNMRRFNRLPCTYRNLFSSLDCTTRTKAAFFSSTTSKHQKTKYQLPKRIILLRHGESLGNVDDTAYSTIPDWKIPLTRR